MIDKSPYIKALKEKLPDLVTDDETAENMVDTIFHVPVKALENGDSVELPKLGHIEIDRSAGENCLCFVPADDLMQSLGARG